MVDVSFYQDQREKIVTPELFSTIAEELARSFSQEKNRNKGTQVRKFYDEVLRLNSRVRAKRENWANIVPYVNMIIAKAAYAEGRNLVTQDFLAFIKKAVSQVKTPEDLDVFTTFFEAFMGFYKKYRPKD